MEDLVRQAFERFTAGGPEAIREFLDPDAEMLGSEPGPWDCHGREAVIRFLYGYQASGRVVQVVEVTDRGTGLFLGLRREQPGAGPTDHFSVLTLKGERLRRMQGYPSRLAALVAAGGLTIRGFARGAPTTGDREYLGGPRHGERERGRLLEEVPAAGGTYRRSVACADDGVVRYLWEPIVTSTSG